MSEVKFTQLAEGVDVVKWSKGDGRIAICTSNVIYVMTPSTLSSAGVVGKTSRQPLLAESFTVTAAELPSVSAKAADLSFPVPQKRVDNFSQEALRDEDTHSTTTVALDPLYCDGTGTFVGCDWCPLDSTTGFLLSGLTSQGNLYLFEPPFSGLRAWKMVHSFADALPTPEMTQSVSSRGTEGPPHQPQESPGPAHQPQESPGPAHQPQEPPAPAHQPQESPGPTHQLHNSTILFPMTTHVKLKGYLRSKRSRARFSQKDHSTVTAFAWQCQEASRTKATLAVGTRSRHVTVFDVTSRFTVTGDRPSTHVSEQLVCRAKVPIPLTHRILCMTWAEETVQESTDSMLAVGCSDGSLCLLYTCPTVEVVACPTQHTDGSSEVDQIPIHCLVWCSSHGQDSGRLLFSKGVAVGVATISSRTLEVVAFVVGGHNFPVAGITEVRTASGIHSLSVGVDGTAQLFDPWGAGSPAAGGGTLKVLQSEALLLQHSPHPPKTLVRGVAASRNEVYFTTVFSVQAFGWLDKVKTEVYFQSVLTPADVEKDFCTPGSYLHPKQLTAPLSPSTTSASSVWDALHLLLGSTTAENEKEEEKEEEKKEEEVEVKVEVKVEGEEEEGEVESPVLSHLLTAVGDLKTAPEMASLLRQIACTCGKEDLVGEADWITMVTHVQISLKDWLKWHRHSDRDPETLWVLCTMAKWLLAQEATDVTPAREIMSEVSAAGVSEVDVQCQCAVCDTELPFVDCRSGLREVCPQGHLVARCSLTLCVLSTPSGRQCCHCMAWAGFPSVDGGPWLKALLARPVCLLCGGPFTCVV